MSQGSSCCPCLIALYASVYVLESHALADRGAPIIMLTKKAHFGQEHLCPAARTGVERYSPVVGRDLEGTTTDFTSSS